MKAVLFVVGTVMVLITNGLPLGNPPVPPIRSRSGIDPFENIIPAPCTTNDNVLTARNGLIDTQSRWTDFNVIIDESFDEAGRQAINDAMYDLQEVLPCVKFGILANQSDLTGDYIRIINEGKDTGCNAHVGRRGGAQKINLETPNCLGHHTILHEMMHALGVHHEQSRPDRDDYVEIIWENITPGLKYAFEKRPDTEVSTFDVPYNIHSIMHYPATAFTTNRKLTIVAKNGETVGPTNKLQDTDIKKLKDMYSC